MTDIALKQMTDTILKQITAINQISGFLDVSVFLQYL